MNSSTSRFKKGIYFLYFHTNNSNRYSIGCITRIEKWKTATGLQRLYHYKYLYKSEEFKKAFYWIGEEDSFSHNSPMYNCSIISENIDDLKQRIFMEIL